MLSDKKNVFISYSRADYVDAKGRKIPNSIVQQVKDFLTANGISYWFDEEGIVTGKTFAEVIVKAIEEADIFLFISTKNSNNSKWTHKEIAVAEDANKYVIPFKADNAPYSSKNKLYLMDLDYISYPHNPDIAFKRLLAAINLGIGNNPPSTTINLTHGGENRGFELALEVDKGVLHAPCDSKPNRRTSIYMQLRTLFGVLPGMHAKRWWVNAASISGVIAYLLGLIAVANGPQFRILGEQVRIYSTRRFNSTEITVIIVGAVLSIVGYFLLLRSRKIYHYLGKLGFASATVGAVLVTSIYYANKWSQTATEILIITLIILLTIISDLFVSKNR